MESRASTRLGENIKLLTFVSIFFLPLSFCMSVWSINTSVFSLRALVITVLLVGLGTYFMVFNLNSMVAFCGRWYSLTKARVVDSMKADIDDKWAEIGRRFVASSPDTEEERKVPSEWRLVLFLFYRMARKMGLERKESKEEPTAVERKSSAVMGVINWGHLPVLGQEDSDAKSVGESRTEEDGEGKELKSVWSRIPGVWKLLGNGSSPSAAATGASSV